MVRGFLILVVSVSTSLLVSCGGSEKPHTNDSDQNAYYTKYVRIYNQYGKISLDSTKEQLLNYITEFPNDAKSWTFLGNIYYQMGEIDSAVACAKQSLVFESNNLEALNSLGSYYNTLNLPDSAGLYLSIAQSVGDSTGYSDMGLAIIEAHKGDTVDFATLANSALHKAGDDIRIVSGISWGYKIIKNDSMANVLYKKAVALRMQDSTLLKSLLEGKITDRQFFENVRY